MKRKEKMIIKRAALCVVGVLILVLFTSFGASRHSTGGASGSGGAELSSGMVESDNGEATDVTANAPDSTKKVTGAVAQPMDRQDELAAAKRANKDAVAWIVMPGADVDAAVMQGPDNAKYLQLDELGNYAEWGCYYADCRDIFASRDALVKNTVVYGHSQSDCDPDGEKFTTLHRYTDAQYVCENPYIFFSVEGEDMVFEIAAVFFTDVAFDYINPDPAALGGTVFYDTVSAANYLAGGNSVIDATDKLLTLSTCCRQHDPERTGNHRLVVMARLLDESEYGKVYSVTQAPNPTVPW